MDQDTNDTKPKSDHTNYAIIGGATGGGILLVTITLVSCFFCMREKTRNQYVSKLISYDVLCRISSDQNHAIEFQPTTHEAQSPETAQEPALTTNYEYIQHSPAVEGSFWFQ